MVNKLLVTSNVQTLQKFLASTTIESALVKDRALDFKIEEIIKRLEGNKYENPSELHKATCPFQAAYLLESYLLIGISSNNKVYGIKDGDFTLLYDGEDSTMMYSEAFGYFQSSIGLKRALE